MKLYRDQVKRNMMIGIAIKKEGGVNRRTKQEREVDRLIGNI